MPPVKKAKTRMTAPPVKVALHVHELPRCTGSRHNRDCRKHGIWLGCKVVYRRRTNEDGKSRYTDPGAACIHLGF